jgi:hypothetical protein
VYGINAMTAKMASFLGVNPFLAGRRAIGRIDIKNRMSQTKHV